MEGNGGSQRKIRLAKKGGGGGGKRRSTRQKLKHQDPKAPPIYRLKTLTSSAQDFEQLKVLNADPLSVTREVFLFRGRRLSLFRFGGRRGSELLFFLHLREVQSQQHRQSGHHSGILQLPTEQKPPVEQAEHPTVYSAPAVWQQQTCSRTCSRNENVYTHSTSIQSWKQKVKFPMKPAIENSLRILTSVIDGMRHWSQFKDKVPYMFEIFATLDSAVTLGRLGAKNFLMRDGREVVTCVFYENEQELPRLIRGQVHRCVGNYDRSRDVLMCVSVRPGLPSELRNAQEAVKACDAEMRALMSEAPQKDRTSEELRPKG
ncbi:Spermatogenesis-associated protein 22 [Liparis tanakae]|uniref:Spermatogenesis-associated protein 22 n=1 Tax=Liparis tanakae TaxID=230148 RepID=A0A4Z2IXQ6_9TELE|nr:Spermatogenesis-associated protein 22 [Liparis tanakae]